MTAEHVFILDGRWLVSPGLSDITDEEQEDGDKCQWQVNGIVDPVCIRQEAGHVQMGSGQSRRWLEQGEKLEPWSPYAPGFGKRLDCHLPDGR